MKNLTHSTKTEIFAYILLMPAVIFLAAIVLVPLVETIRLSFTNTGLSKNWEYVGLQNYEKMFSKKFGSVIGITFLWVLIGVSLKITLGTIGAVLLNAPLRGRSLFRVLTIPPWIVPLSIGMIGWVWMYNGQFGLVSHLMQELGIFDGPYEILAYPKSAFVATIVSDVWVGVPFVAIFILAAIQNVPIALYEAAWVDGATRWHRFAKITLPQIAPVMGTMSLLSSIMTFNSFEVIWILTRGGPRMATTTMIIDSYKTGIGRFKYGEGSARAVITVLVLSIFIALYFLFLRHLERERKAL